MATECIYFNKPWLSTPWLGSLAFDPELLPACTKASGTRGWPDPKFRETLGCPQDRLCMEAWRWGPRPCKVAAGRGPAAKCWHRPSPPLALNNHQAIAEDATVPPGTPSPWDDAKVGTEPTCRRFPRTSGESRGGGGVPLSKAPEGLRQDRQRCLHGEGTIPKDARPNLALSAQPRAQGLLHIAQTCF